MSDAFLPLVFDIFFQFCLRRHHRLLATWGKVSAPSPNVLLCNVVLRRLLELSFPQRAGLPFFILDIYQ